MHLNHQAFANAIELKSADEGGDVDANAIVTKALGNLTGTVESRLAAVEKKSADRLDQIEARLNRPSTAFLSAAEPTLERKAFSTFVRRGAEHMQADEVKALTLANDASGGYLAPEELASTILTKLVEFSPIRAYASVMSIGAETVKFPRQVSGTSAFWVGETDDRTPSDMVFEQVSIKPFELATFVDLSLQLLEDNAYNLESFLAEDIAKKFGKTEGLAFVKGTGAANNQPTGILTAAGIVEIKTGAAATFATANPIDTLIAMYHKLPSAYARNGVWLMNNTTLGEIRKWKDGNGYPFVLDVINGGFSTLLGRPVVEAVDMDDIGAGKFPIVFGDMSGYRIVDRIGFNMLRDPYTLAAKGQVRIHARKRVGADVLDPAGFVKLKVAA